MTELTHTRKNDSEILTLIERVESLETGVHKLRADFTEHEKDAHLKLELLNANLVSIQVKLDKLLLDVHAPLEAYKSAQAGFTFVKFIAETAKWLVPICVGIFIAYAPK